METNKRSKGKSLKATDKKSKWQVTELSSLHSELNVAYCRQDFVQSAKSAWQSKAKKDSILLEKEAVIHKSPFTCCFLPSFVEDPRFLEGLRDELLGLTFHEKNNDLYKFLQSQDLKKVSTPHVSTLRKFIYGDFRRWLVEVTGIELDDTVDMSCAQYNNTDVLLCHDDELEGRRIAYILYLVDKDWDSSDGGALDLFSADENNQPKDIVKSILPQWNSLAFFAVTPLSYHQVAEVLGEGKCRLSVSGWFHGPPIKRPAPYNEPVGKLLKPVDMEEDKFYEWINPAYLNPETMGDVQEKFGDESEIQLHDFLNKEKYQKLSEALTSSSIKWTSRGPANKRRYLAATDSLPDIVEEALQFFKSEAFFLVLSNLAGLKLHHLAPTPSGSEEESDSEDRGKSVKPAKKRKKEIDPCCKLQLTRWSPGCYTLIHDEDADNSSFALDVWFFANVNNWQIEQGGHINYIAREEDEELLTVCPMDNCLALVYRDKDTLRFVKYLNNKSSDPSYFTISGVYYERH